jgi:dethiobiotin synthetase
MKPVASGCERIDGELRNEDALMLQAQSSLPLDYRRINPYAFAPAIAPHLAAAQVGERIDLDSIVDAYTRLATEADWLVVEGAGGWHVPLNESDDIATLARRLALPVVLVVGLRLGCINHALLSAEAIRASGCELVGWIANHLDTGMPLAEENIHAIASRINAPLLGVMPFCKEGHPAEQATTLQLP